MGNIKIGTKWIYRENINKGHNSPVWFANLHAITSDGHSMYRLSHSMDSETGFWYTEEGILERYTEIVFDTDEPRCKFLDALKRFAQWFKRGKPSESRQEPVPDDVTGIQWFIDGDQVVIVEDDFINLQESPAVFVPVDSTPGNLLVNGEGKHNWYAVFSMEEQEAISDLLADNGGHLYGSPQLERARSKEE
jgi:hypothetical protein